MTTKLMRSDLLTAAYRATRARVFCRRVCKWHLYSTGVFWSVLLLLLLRRLCLAPARWALLRLLAPVPRLPLQVLFLLRMRLCPASRSGFLPLSEPFGVWWCCAAAPTEGCFCLRLLVEFLSASSFCRSFSFFSLACSSIARRP